MRQAGGSTTYLVSVRHWRLLWLPVSRMEVERQAKAEAQRRQRTTFAAVAEDFIAHKLPSERGGQKD